MHKKLEGELVSLAHSILQMKNRDNVYALHEKAAKIYEQLSVLKFVEDYIGTTPNLKESREEILAKVIDASEQSEKDISGSAIKEVVEQLETAETVEENKGEIEVVSEMKEEIVIDTPEKGVVQDIQITFEKEEKNSEDATEEISEVVDEIPVNEPKQELEEEVQVQLTLEEEIKEAISADLATSMFESATKETPVFVRPESPKKRSINDAVLSQNLQIGLNDRIAFVKHLFDDSQEDFNRVISQLNSFSSEQEAKEFVENFVKPDYNWEGKEEYEERLFGLIERKFA